MSRHRVWSDFNALRGDGLVTLECHGSIVDLSSQNVKLVPDLELTVYDDSEGDTLVEMDGMAVYLREHPGWFARLDMSTLRRVPKTTSNCTVPIELYCFHCRSVVDDPRWERRKQIDLTIRCEDCGGLIMEAVLPPDEETA